MKASFRDSAYLRREERRKEETKRKVDTEKATDKEGSRGRKTRQKNTKK